MKIEIDINFDARALWWYVKGETPNTHQVFNGDGPSVVSAMTKAGMNLRKIFDDHKNLWDKI